MAGALAPPKSEMYRGAGRGDIAAFCVRRSCDRLSFPLARGSSVDIEPAPNPTPLLLSNSSLVAIPVGRVAIAAAAAFVGGIVNAIAGGGTLFTFPALVAAGMSPLVANATSTVALVPGALTSMLGYRGELAGARRWALMLTLPSLLGGGLGAWLLLHTPGTTFDDVVPWLVLGATTLFIVQRPLLAWVRRHHTTVLDDAALTAAGPTPALLAWQFAVGIYGGYFGAGVGILMLAALGFMGFTNLHRMNGLKNWGGFCMNIVASVTFAVSGIVDWPIALIMLVGSTTGGYLGSKAAQRVPQQFVRVTVAIIGTVSGLWLLFRHH